MENCIALISENETSILKSAGTSLKSCSIHKDSGYCTSTDGSLLSIKSESISVVPLKTKVSQLSVFNWACLMISREGLTYAKGEDLNESGILGIVGINSLKDFTLIPSLLDSPAKHVCLGSNHAVMVDEIGSLWTWGSGRSLGIYENADNQPPLEVSSARAFKVSKALCREDFTLLITEEGSVYIYGSLFRQDTDTGILPRKVIDNYYVADIAAGDKFLVFLTDDHQAFYWDDSDIPVKLPVKNERVILKIGATDNSAFGLANNQLVYQWNYKHRNWKAKIYQINTQVSNLFSTHGQIALCVQGDQVHKKLVDCIKNELSSKKLLDAYESPKLSPITTMEISQSCFLSNDVLDNVLQPTGRPESKSLGAAVRNKFQIIHLHSFAKLVVKLANNRLVSGFEAIKAGNKQEINLQLFGVACMANIIKTLVERTQRNSVMTGFRRIKKIENKSIGFYNSEGQFANAVEGINSNFMSESSASYSLDLLKNELFLYFLNRLCEHFEKFITKNALEFWQIYTKKQSQSTHKTESLANEIKTPEYHDTTKNVRSDSEKMKTFISLICGLIAKWEYNTEGKYFYEWKQFSKINSEVKVIKEKSELRNNNLYNSNKNLDSVTLKKCQRRSLAILYSLFKKRVKKLNSEVFCSLKSPNGHKYKWLSIFLSKLLSTSRQNNLKTSFDTLKFSLLKPTSFKMIRQALQTNAKMPNTPRSMIKIAIPDKNALKTKKLDLKMYQKELMSKIVLRNNTSPTTQRPRKGTALAHQQRSSTERRLNYDRLLKEKMVSKPNTQRSNSRNRAEKKINFIKQSKIKSSKVLLNSARERTIVQKTTEKRIPTVNIILVD